MNPGYGSDVQYTDLYGQLQPGGVAPNVASMAHHAARNAGRQERNDDYSSVAGQWIRDSLRIMGRRDRMHPDPALATGNTGELGS